MVAWDRRRYLLIPRPCRKHARFLSLYGIVPRASIDGAKIVQSSTMRTCSQIAERR